MRLILFALLVAFSFNFLGIFAAKGKEPCFLDDDDEVLPADENPREGPSKGTESDKPNRQTKPKPPNTNTNLNNGSVSNNKDKPMIPLLFKPSGGGFTPGGGGFSPITGGNSQPINVGRPNAEKKAIEFTLEVSYPLRASNEECDPSSLKDLWNLLATRLRESGRKGGGGDSFAHNISMTKVIQDKDKTKNIRNIKWEGTADCKECFSDSRTGATIRSSFLMMFQRRITHRMNDVVTQIADKSQNACISSGVSLDFKVEGASMPGSSAIEQQDTIPVQVKSMQLLTQFQVSLDLKNENADTEACSKEFKDKVNGLIEAGVKKYGAEYHDHFGDTLRWTEKPKRRLTRRERVNRRLRRMRFVWSGWTACRWCGDDDTDASIMFLPGSNDPPPKPKPLSRAEKLSNYISEKLTSDVNKMVKAHTKKTKIMSCMGYGNGDIVVSIKFGNSEFVEVSEPAPSPGTGKKNEDTSSTAKDATESTLKQLDFTIEFDILRADGKCDAVAQKKLDEAIVESLKTFEKKYPKYLELNLQSRGGRARRLLRKVNQMHRSLYRFVWSGWSGCNQCDPDDSDGGPATASPVKALHRMVMKKLRDIQWDVSLGLSEALNKFARKETSLLGKPSCIGQGDGNILATFQFKALL